MPAADRACAGALRGLLVRALAGPFALTLAFTFAFPLGLAVPAQAQTPAAEAQPAAAPVAPDPAPNPAQASPVPPPAQAASAADGPLAAWVLRIEAPDDLRELLTRYLDIARFVPVQAASPAPASVGSESDMPAVAPVRLPAARAASTPAPESIGRVELNRLAAAAPAQARELLETEGYFGATVTVRIEEGKPALVRVSVTPGPRTRVTRARVIFEGPLFLNAEEGDPKAAELTRTLSAGWSLPAGQAFSQSAWSDAKNNLLAALRAQGYPYAAYSGTNAQVDARTNEATLFMVVNSGPLVRLGAIGIEGLSYVQPRVVTRLSPFGAGDPYSERALLDFQDRLVKTGLFDTVTIGVDLDAQAPGSAAGPGSDPTTPGTEVAEADLRERTLPVQVRLRERSQRQTTLGVGFSDSTGPRVTLEQVDRRLFGRNLVGKARVEVGGTRQSLAADITTHPLPDRYRNLVSSQISREEASDLIVLNQKLRVGRAQDGERIERLLYYEWQRADARPIGEGVRSLASAYSVNYNWIWRDLDNVVLPTVGYSANAEVGAGRAYNTSAIGDDWFSRAQARITGYWLLGRSWYGQARIQGAQAFARDGLLPYTLLFRAGGDESVRGYGYQDIGPSANGSAVGARVMATGSVELARPVSVDLPSIWLAGFFDAGGAASTWGDFTAERGWGVGVRWRSPVGPLRADYAYGESVKRWRVHFSVGIAF